MNKHADNRINKSIGKNIRTIRNERNWSQEFVATKLGISVPAFSKIENGITDVNLSRLEEIAGIYEIAVSQLFDGVKREKMPLAPKLNNIQNDIVHSDKEIVDLQNKLISLYEELRTKSSAVV